MLPTLLLGGGRGAGSPAPSSVHTPRQCRSRSGQERREGREAELCCGRRAHKANPTPQPSSAWGSCPRAEGAWAESIMRRPGQGSPGQSNALSDQRSTCWVVGWEGLGRKRLDWSGGPPRQRAGQRHRGDERRERHRHGLSKQPKCTRATGTPGCSRELTCQGSTPGGRQVQPPASRQAMSSSPQVNKHSPYLLGSLEKTPQPGYPESPAP